MKKNKHQTLWNYFIPFDTPKKAMFAPCWINFCGSTVKYSVNSDNSHDKKQQKTDTIKTTPFSQASVATLAQKSHCKSTDRAKYGFWDETKAFSYSVNITYYAKEIKAYQYCVYNKWIMLNWYDQ